MKAAKTRSRASKIVGGVNPKRKRCIYRFANKIGQTALSRPDAHTGPVRTP